MDKIKWAAGVVGAFISPHLGGMDKVLTGLLAAMVLDYATGLMVAGQRKSNKSETGGIDSRAGLKGIYKKLGMLVGVALTVQLDIVTGADMFRGFVIMFFLANEGISIVENLSLIGVPFPDSIKQALDVMREKANKGAAKDE